MKDDIAKELLAPLADEYASTDADRERVRAKLRERLGGAVVVGSTSIATSWLAQRHVLGAIVGVAGVAAVAVFGSLSSSPPAAASAPAASLAPSSAATATSDPEGEPASSRTEAPAVPVDQLPSAASPASPAPPGNAAPRRLGLPSGPHADDALVRETRLMASANEALRSGDLRRALALFDQHAREFPRGVLADERAVSRVVIFCQLGLRDEAAREGKRFLETHAPSPLTRRVESSCAGRRTEMSPAETDEDRSP